jgi:hypothetical protein
MKKPTPTLAVFWTLSLIVNVLSACIGVEPTWTLVFVPLTTLVMDRWKEYFQNRK